MIPFALHIKTQLSCLLIFPLPKQFHSYIYLFSVSALFIHATQKKWNLSWDCSCLCIFSSSRLVSRFPRNLSAERVSQMGLCSGQLPQHTRWHSSPSSTNCFKAFGDRVKYWITFNEPRGLTIQGYDTGIQAPGRCSLLGHWFCKEGKSSVEPYIVAHNILLSHAAAYHTKQWYLMKKNFYFDIIRQDQAGYT